MLAPPMPLFQAQVSMLIIAPNYREAAGRARTEWEVERAGGKRESTDLILLGDFTCKISLPLHRHELNSRIDVSLPLG